MTSLPVLLLLLLCVLIEAASVRTRRPAATRRPTTTTTTTTTVSQLRHKHQFPGYPPDELQYVNYTNPRPWQINRNVCPPSLCAPPSTQPTTRKPLLLNGKPTPGRPSVTRQPNNGGGVRGEDIVQQDWFPFFEADIVLDEHTQHVHPEVYHRQQLKRGRNHRHQQQQHRGRRATVKLQSKLWPDAVVPYELDPQLPDETKDLIEKAIEHFANYTCIRFQQKTSADVDYISIVYQPGCWSQVGRVGGKQLISFGESCEQFGTIVHEMTHTLGFWHEQSRPDRDNYIDILWDNLEPDAFDQFNKRTENESTSHGYVYDYHSISHYGDNYYSMSLNHTIETVGIGHKFNFSIGQRKRLSSLDIAQLNAMYSCFTKDAQQRACPVGWVKYRLRCYLFVTNDTQQFYAAARNCRTKQGSLVAINNWREDNFLKSHLKSNYPETTAWLTSGLRVPASTNFVWYTMGSTGQHPSIVYTAWTNESTALTSRDQPAANPLSVVLSRSVNGSNMEIVWSEQLIGTRRQPERFKLPFICETKSQIPCFTSKSGFGRDYRGTLSYTTEGAMCQRWTRRYPHNHTLITGNTVRDALEGLGNHNYCRNPHGLRRRPWCFTLLKAVKWQYCDVLICH